MKIILSNKVADYNTFVNEKSNAKVAMALGAFKKVASVAKEFGYDEKWLADQFLNLFRDKYEQEVSKQKLDPKQKKRLDGLVLKPLENGGLEKGINFIGKQVNVKALGENYINEALIEIDEKIDWNDIKIKAAKFGKKSWEKVVLPGIKMFFNLLAKLLVNITFAIISSFKDEEVSPPKVQLFDTKKGKEFLEIKPSEA